MAGNVHTTNRRKHLGIAAAGRLKQKKTDAARDRSRLIDHFKRLYTIAGLAITEACRKLIPFDPSTFSPASALMFFAFLITIVPIFQGGDRSLDLKYLDERSDGRAHNRWAFIWDVFMLIITALIFVMIAESIPAVGEKAPTVSTFAFAMSGLFLFDVAVLIIDLWKSHVSQKLSSYRPWILMNFALFLICLAVAFASRAFPEADHLAPFAALLATCAAYRSYLDYLFSKSFMFP